MPRICRLHLRPVLVSALLAFFLAGCAIVPLPTRSPRVGDADAPGSCADFFASLDRRVEKSLVLDAGAFRVEGYPYLRVNRFLASFRGETGEPAAFRAWVDRMQALDQEARRYEIANLARAARPARGPEMGPSDPNARVAGCGNLLKSVDLQDDPQRQRLREKATAPDEYLTFWRVLGLYPLTRRFVHRGVLNWHAEARQGFSTEPPVGWRTLRYVPEKISDVPEARKIVTQAERDALGIPSYSAAAREALFRIYAPAWEVQTEADFDRIGTPVWPSAYRLDVDTGRPATYTLLSFTRFGQEILTQLNYIIWFPARPKLDALDIYGGHLDGVNYRVTLDTDGEPLLYESIHNCGCYYGAYPTRRLRVREKIDYAEPPLIFQAPELTPSEQLMAVAMASRTHYIQHLYPLPRRTHPGAVVYALADYGELRSLPQPTGGRRSMFGTDSLAPGSERLERFILWPTGVVSPGAMRQWGRHAVAFVGERQFDDPFAMGRMFSRTEP